MAGCCSRKQQVKLKKSAYESVNTVDGPEVVDHPAAVYETRVESPLPLTMKKLLHRKDKDKKENRDTEMGSQIRMINEDLSIPEQKVTYSVRDVLELIPTFAGTDVCEYIHFQEGCMEALELIGPENERTLLKFLKTKLKGNALTRFQLHVARYDRLMRFLKAIKKEYNYTETHDGDFWLAQMAALKQKKGEPVREYGKRMENLLQCAIIATEPGFHIKTDADKNPVKKVEVELLEAQAFQNFQKNMTSNELQGYLGNYHLKARNMLDIITAAELWENVVRKRSNSSVWPF